MGEFLIVLNKNEDTLSVIDLDSREIMRKIDCGHNPHEIAITPDGKKSYITCSLGDEINVLDNEELEIKKVLKHERFDFPHGLDILKGRNELFMASTYSSRIFVIDIDDDEIKKHFPTYQKHSHMIAPSKQEDKVFIPNIGSDNITVVDPEKQKVVNHFPVGEKPEGIAVHPDTGNLYVANQEENTSYVIDSQDYDTLYKRRLGKNPIRIIFSPDGKYAFIPNRESNDVSVIHTDFGKGDKRVPWEIKRIPVGIWPGGTVFDEKGEKAYVANNKTNDISIIDVESLESEKERIDVGIHPDGIGYFKK